MKICKKCNESKDLDQFSPHTLTKDGRRTFCKECVKINTAAWRKNNPERKRAIDASYRRANTKKTRAATSAWAKAHPEKESARKTAWEKAHPEKIRIKSQNRRARKLASGGKLSPDLAAKLLKLQRGKCACCNKRLGKSYHLDHVMPLALGGSNTDDNIQLLHAHCNMQKTVKHPLEFMQQRGFLL